THLDLLQSENSAGPLQQLYEQIILLQNHINITRGQLVRDRLRLMVAEKNDLATISLGDALQYINALPEGLLYSRIQTIYPYYNQDVVYLWCYVVIRKRLHLSRASIAWFCIYQDYCPKEAYFIAEIAVNIIGKEAYNTVRAFQSAERDIHIQIYRVYFGPDGTIQVAPDSEPPLYDQSGKPPVYKESIEREPYEDSQGNYFSILYRQIKTPNGIQNNNQRTAQIKSALEKYKSRGYIFKPARNEDKSYVRTFMDDDSMFVDYGHIYRHYIPITGHRLLSSWLDKRRKNIQLMSWNHIHKCVDLSNPMGKFHNLQNRKGLAPLPRGEICLGELTRQEFGNNLIEENQEWIVARSSTVWNTLPPATLWA
ncbi:unnamed protein product, partial [Clonostachys solani]